MKRIGIERGHMIGDQQGADDDQEKTAETSDTKER
jgi:hypothetical protein